MQFGKAQGGVLIALGLMLVGLQVRELSFVS
jgi:hypothetical protein